MITVRFPANTDRIKLNQMIRDLGLEIVPKSRSEFEAVKPGNVRAKKRMDFAGTTPSLEEK